MKIQIFLFILLMQVIFKSCQAAIARSANYGFSSNIPMPPTIGVLGYGAIGKAFIDIVLHNNPKANIVVSEKLDQERPDNRFKYLKRKMATESMSQIFSDMGLKKGDFLVDLSTNVEFLELWPHCQNNGIRYMNTALELWEHNENAISFPKNDEELYRTSLGHIKDQAEKLEIWNTKKGSTSVLEMGMNPGLISNFVKRGIEDAAKHFLHDPTATDINKKDLEKFIAERNHSKLAQILGLHTIHCSEWDNQKLTEKPKDITKKLYNTWSCKGLLTEGLVPIQVARGSHEDKAIKGYGVVRDGKTIMSYIPSTQVWANSWVPNQNIKGSLIPHGESYTLYDYLHDAETGYAPSMYYVYDYNPYAKEFIFNLPKTSTVDEVNPDSEVIHPMNHPSIRGVDKVGALLCMKNNRGWWTGSIMDDVDAQGILSHKFGPTVLQVAAGVYSGFLWACKHPNEGITYPEYLDTDFIIDHAKPFLGRYLSRYVDLKETSVKDCHKLQSFLCDQPQL